MRLRGDEAIDRERINSRISVNRQDVFIEGWVDTDDILNLMIHLQLHWVHG